MSDIFTIVIAAFFFYKDDSISVDQHVKGKHAVHAWLFDDIIIIMAKHNDAFTCYCEVRTNLCQHVMLTGFAIV